MRTFFLHLALIAIFGVILPFRKGVDFLDPVLVSAYACMGVIFAAPAAAAAFAKARPQSMPEAFVRAGKSIAYGEGLALVMLIAGVVTVNLGRKGQWWLPELSSLGDSALLGLMATITIALLTGWMTLRFSERAAQLGTRVLFLLLLLGFFFRSQRLPEIALTGALFCLVASALTIQLLYREVHPR